MPIKTELQRFWEKVNKTDSCWLWTGSKRSKGYGAFVYIKDGLVVQGRAHRYSYEIHKGLIPEGVFVLHNCPNGDNPACINPAHLWLGNNLDNVQDMIKKGRRVKGGTHKPGKYEHGTAHHNAKLTEENVKTIREKYATGKTSFSKLAREYTLGIAHVYRIVRRKAWAHIP
jgi:hypothetical protein